VTLRQSLGSSFSVAVADPALAHARMIPPPLAGEGGARSAPGGGLHAGNGRATAIVASARRLLTTIGVWERIEAQPILDMVITDSRLTDAVRPTFLTFAGEVEPGEPFGHMVENAPLIDALLERASAEGIVLFPAAVADVDLPPSAGEHTEFATRASDRVAVTLAGGEEISTRLLVAADGARSAIRERAGIAVHGWPYGQCAIVTTVAHERDHQGRAIEHFLPAGPFAIF